MIVQRIFTIELRPTPGGLWEARCCSFPGTSRIANAPHLASASLRTKLLTMIVRRNGEEIKFKGVYPIDEDEPVAIEELKSPTKRLIMPSHGRLAEAINALPGRVGKRIYNNEEHWTLDGKYARIHEILTAAGLPL